MQTKKTFWRATVLLLVVTAYFLIEDYSFWWSLGYFGGIFLVFCLFLFFRGAFRSNERQENVEHLIDCFPKEKTD